MGKTKGVAEEIGTLYIISTPIGNLKDATHRSLERSEERRVGKGGRSRWSTYH